LAFIHGVRLWFGHVQLQFGLVNQAAIVLKKSLD